MRLAIVLAGCWTGVPTVEPTASPAPPPAPAATIATLTPPGLVGVWLGMSLAELIEARPKAIDEGSYPHDPYLIYEEKNPSPKISRVAFWMRRRGEQRERVYQIGVTYRGTTEAKRVFEDHYVPRGKRHSKGWDDDKMSEQIHIRGFEFLVGAWTYANSLTVGAAIPETPFEDGQFQKP